MPRIPQRLAGIAAATVLGAALLAVPGASAQQGTQTPTQMAPAATPSAPHSTARAPRADRVEARIKTLHAQLKITPDEEPLWNNVAQVMRENARTIDQLASERSAKRTGMTAIDNLRSYEEIADAHAAEMKKLVPAFEALYAKMSDTQKKTADAVFNQRQRARAAAKRG
jgi:protein CpxP